MRTRFSTRRARLRDLDGILEIERASFGGEAYDRNLFAEYFHNCGDLFLVVECLGSLWGYMITCTRGDRAELISVAVDPARRAQGVACALMESTLRRLRRRGAARLLLMVRETNEAARAFYGKYGFKKVKKVRRYYEDEADAWLMARNL